MRIGIFGGTFNPPHLGHKRLAEEMKEKARLDKIIIMPTFTPPHKKGSDLASEKDRLNMCRLLFKEGCYQVSDLEITRGGKSYTVDTVTELKKLYPDDELFLIIGSDMLLSFDRWYRFEDILDNVTLCVATRENDISAEDLLSYAKDKLKLDTEDIVISTVDAFVCSSTQVRNLIKEEGSTEGILDKGVKGYIDFRRLYSDEYTSWRKLLKERLVEKRYIHSLNVADSARELAERYGYDTDKAYFAGLVHDIMKNATEEEQLQIMEKGGIILSRTEKNNPKLWHAMAGEAYLRTEMGITDNEILSAVRYHTTGRAGMSLLDKIVYIADYISVERDYPDADVMRELSKEGLDEAALYALKYSFASLSAKEKLIHTDSVEYYNELIINKAEKEKRQ